ncbi:type II toxin-antitoxin system RelE/ParE family toxin [Anatilimnocola floriformis]|uniref:type II toxin-antitoxin system RelE/ParE family toxin n=1 Tax=Anatilimnocola floriformis TaxID=2948575 RepID=UPI0028F3F805|nr:type II toxin-antitoxin system RelE/ParE family toxin [Anatilimnocola floriformis]
MAKSVSIRPGARIDIVDQALYLDQRSAAAALRFLDECDATIQMLQNSPGIGGLYLTSVQRLAGIRVFPIRGFPNHLIFYFDHSTNIEIVRVLHGARDLDAALVDF